MIEKIQRAVASLHNKKDNDEKGFSLIELIVVVAILGILIAIAIPVFNGLQDRATINSAKSAAANAATEVASQIATGATASLPDATEEFSFSWGGAGAPATVDAVCVTVSAVSGTLPTLEEGDGDYSAGPGC